MEDKTVSTASTPNTTKTETATSSSNEQTHIASPVAEHRQAYGTAKTESLRDNGLWRIILPAFVILCCLILFAIPLVILIPLLSESLNPQSASRLAGDNLVWVWITLIILAVGTAVVVTRGLYKIFLTQAENYHKG